MKKALFFLPLLFSGCLTPPDPQWTSQDLSKEIPLPENIKLLIEKPWWHSFQSSNFEKFVQQALEESYKIKQKKLRILQNELKYQKDASTLYPDLAFSMKRSHQQAQVETKTKTGTKKEIKTNDSWNLSLNFSYTIDLFQEEKNKRSSSDYAIIASIEEFKNDILNLSKEIGKIYIQIVEAEKLLTHSLNNISIEEKNTQLVMAKLKQGTATPLDAHQASSRLTELQLDVIQQQKQLTSLKNKFYSYTKKETSLSFELPEKYPSLPEKIPFEMILKRPDFQSLFAKLKASSHDVASAEAARYPRFSISTSLSNTDEKFLDVITFDKWVWNLAANLTAPLFDAGGRKANAQRMDLVFQENTLGYESSYYDTVIQIKDILISQEYDLKKLNITQKLMEESQLSLQITSKNYLNGLTSWNEVLTAQKKVYTLERSLIQLNVSLWQNWLSLTSSLGGNWISKIQTPSQGENL